MTVAPPTPGTDAPDRPVEPIKQQHFQIVGMDPWKLEPCRPDDPRPGGLLISVDAYGRVVSPIYDAPIGGAVIGWRLGNAFGVELSSVDPAEVLAFWEAEAARRRHEAAERSRGRDS